MYALRKAITAMLLALVCTGMGSRGLSFALLCGELLAAQMNDEPWPVERSIGLALSPERFSRAHA